MDSPLFIFSIRRIIVIIESVKSVENKLKVRHTKFLGLFKKLWIKKIKKRKLSTSYFIFFLIDSISKRKLSSSSIKDLIFAWA